MVLPELYCQINNVVFHTRQCFGLAINLALVTKSLLELQPASVQQSISCHGRGMHHLIQHALQKSWKCQRVKPRSAGQSMFYLLSSRYSLSCNDWTHKSVSYMESPVLCIVPYSGKAHLEQGGTSYARPCLEIIHHLLCLHERDTCAIAYKIHLTAQQRTCLLHTWSVQGRGIDSKSVSAADLHS